MKLRRILFIVGALLVSQSVVAQKIPNDGRLLQFRRAKPILAPVSHIYAPFGFDDNDVAEVFVEGTFETDCYQIKEIIKNIDHSRRIIRLDLIAVKTAAECRAKKTPYLKRVDLDVLKSGPYKVEAGNDIEGGRLESAFLEVRHTRSKLRDDFLYAPVNSFMLSTSHGGKRTITLLGFYSNPCYEFDLFNTRVETPAVSDPSILVIRPVVNEIPKAHCPEQPTPFAQKIDIPDYIPNGRYLFHIRTPENSFDQIGYLGLKESHIEER